MEEELEGRNPNKSRVGNIVKGWALCRAEEADAAWRERLVNRGRVLHGWKLLRCMLDLHTLAAVITHLVNDL